jgi:hypothetical protein
MSAILNKHRVQPKDEDAELVNELIEEMESGELDTDEEMPTDPRWDALKGFKTGDDE